MKIKENSFMTHQIEEEILVLPIGDGEHKIQGIIRLNETGLFLWQLLQKEQSKKSLIESLMDEYDVDVDIAEKDVSMFIEKLNEMKCLE